MAMRNRAGFMKGKNGQLFSNKEKIAVVSEEKPKQTPQLNNSAQGKREEIRKYHMEQERIRKEQIEQERLCFEQKKLEKHLQEQAQLEKKKKEMEALALVTPEDSQLANAGIKLTFRPDVGVPILPQKKHITYEEMLLFIGASNGAIVKSNGALGKEFNNFLTEQSAWLSTVVPIIYMHLIALGLGGFAYCDFLSKPRYDCVGVYFSRKFADKMICSSAYAEIFAAILPHFKENCCIDREPNATNYANWLRRFSAKSITSFTMPTGVSAVTAFFCKFPNIFVLQKKTITDFIFINNSITNNFTNKAAANNSKTSLLEQKMKITEAKVIECDGFEIISDVVEFSNDFCKCYVFCGENNSIDAKYLFVLPHGGICIESIICANRCIENIIKQAVSSIYLNEKDRGNSNDINDSQNKHLCKFIFPDFEYTAATNPTEYIVEWIHCLSRDYPEDAKKYCASIAGHINNTAVNCTHVGFNLGELFSAKSDIDFEKITKVVTFNHPFLIIQLAKNNQLVSLMKVGSAKSKKVEKNTNDTEEADDTDNTDDTEKTTLEESKTKLNEKQTPSEMVYIVDDL